MIDVPTLSLPDEADASPEALLRSDAVALFVERAGPSSRASPSTTRTPPRSSASARTSTASPWRSSWRRSASRPSASTALDRGLAARLGALGTGDRSASLRQQTLEGAIDWSYQLLSEPERLLWARLSVFAGGFELDAASGGLRRRPGSTPRPSPELVGSPRREVRRQATRRAHADRFRLLEPLRQFGRERLRDARDGTRTAVPAPGLDRRASRRRGGRATPARSSRSSGSGPSEPTSGRRSTSASMTRPRPRPAIAICTRPLGLLVRAGTGRATFAGSSTSCFRWSRRAHSATRSRGRADPDQRDPGVHPERVRAWPSQGSTRRSAIGRETADADVVARSLTFLASVEWVSGRPADVRSSRGRRPSRLARSMHLPGVDAPRHGRPRLRVPRRRRPRRGDLDRPRRPCSSARASARRGSAASPTSSWPGRAWREAISTTPQRPHNGPSVCERDLDDRIGMAHTIALFASIEMPARETATDGHAARRLGGDLPSRSRPRSWSRSANRQRQAADAARRALGRRCLRGGLRARAGDDPRRGGRLRARVDVAPSAPDRAERSRAGRAALAPRDGGRGARRRGRDERPGGRQPVHLRANGREPPGEHLQQARASIPGSRSRDGSRAARSTAPAESRSPARRTRRQNRCRGRCLHGWRREHQSPMVWARTTRSPPDHPEARMPSAITTTDLSKHYPGVTALDGLDPRRPAGFDLRLPRRQRRGQDHRHQDPRRPHATDQRHRDRRRRPAQRRRRLQASHRLSRPGATVLRVDDRRARPFATSPASIPGCPTRSSVASTTPSR